MRDLVVSYWWLAIVSVFVLAIVLKKLYEANRD